MLKRIAPVVLCLLAANASVAIAQPGGGRKGEGRPSGARPPPAAHSTVKPLEIMGVVKAIDTGAGRLTIAYGAVEALGWPAGAQPFPVAKTALLSGVTVGEKIAFTLDSGAVATVRPLDAQ